MKAVKRYKFSIIKQILGMLCKHDKYNTALCYISKLTVNPKRSHYKEKNLFYIFNFVSVWDDIHETYDNHFMVY